MSIDEEEKNDSSIVPKQLEFELLIDVVDTGIGIDSKEKDMLFKFFGKSKDSSSYNK